MKNTILLLISTVILICPMMVMADDFTNVKISSVYIRSDAQSVALYTDPVIPPTCANSDGSVVITTSLSPNQYDNYMLSLALALHTANKAANIEVNCTNKKVLRIMTNR